MAENYNFLRSFTFDGSETSHLFQIAKVNIPFMAKENEMMQVGNTDGKHFMSTRVSETSITIDGFLIKDNSKMNIYDTKDQLVRILNSDEPKQLVFDIFPTRYFNAIYTGVQEYDATDPDYTPVTLVFDVPDGLAHSIEPSGFSNVYTTGTNLVLDSEFNNTKKYMNSWVRKLDEKFDGSNIVRGDMRFDINNVVDRNDQWFYRSPQNSRKIPELKKGDWVNFSAYIRVVEVDDVNKYAGSVTLEEYTNGKKNEFVHFARFDNKVTDGFIKVGGLVQIEGDNTNGIGLSVGMYGDSVVDMSKPMMSLLPPLVSTVKEPIAGATLYSNSLEWGDYDYSGNPNLAITKPDMFSVGVGATVTYENGEYTAIMDGSNRLSKYNVDMGGVYLNQGETYTLSMEIFVGDDYTGNIDQIYVGYNYQSGGYTLLQTSRIPSSGQKGQWYKVSGTSTIDYQGRVPSKLYFSWQTVANTTNPTGTLKIRKIKIEKGSTATPMQPNLLNEPWQVSKLALNENIRSKSVVFPINTSAYQVYGARNTKNYEAGKKYTVTMKATKASTQSFNVFMNSGSIGVGAMTPVEGLTDVWKKTFTVSQANIDAGVDNLLVIYQVPSSTVGSVKIEWLKVEEGEIATPPIDFYKYRGLGTFPSNNPHDYSWGYDPNYYKAITYVPSEEGVSDALIVRNDGTYRAYPNFTFKMKGENGLVALLKEDGSILQFGNPEDVDGNVAKRTEVGLRETFWGKTLNPNIVVNSGFKTVYPNMNSNPSTPNLVQGTLNMTQDPDAVVPVFTGVGDIGVWHGPTMMMPVSAPSTNDRTGLVSTHTRFQFYNYDKAQRGRIEFSTFDETGEPVMTAIVRDSSLSGNEMRLECWYKRQKLVDVPLDRKTFTKDFYEINMSRVGNELRWRLVQIRNLVNNPEGWDQATVDKQYAFTWKLDEPDTSQIMKYGIWQMRYSNKYHVLMKITDCQVRWEGTPYYTDVKNYFQDGDIVEIDVQNRALYVNGAENTELNVVGNQWESFQLELGETLIQPVVSDWANMAEVTCALREAWL